MLDPGLRAALEHLWATTPVIATLAQGKANRITSVGDDGVRIATERSERERVGPQLVPAWMLNVAWRHLTVTGRLANTELVATDGLNVKRSSAVCALLARLPGVTVASSGPIVLIYGRRSSV